LQVILEGEQVEEKQHAEIYFKEANFEEEERNVEGRN